MGFATAWIEKNALFPELIKEPPDDETGIIVVIPAYDEPGIVSLLDSLSVCHQPECRVEIIIIVNAPQEASSQSLLNNILCINKIERWKEINNRCFFRLFVYNAGKPELPGWGVGMARKTGMDEAIRRFNGLDRKDGVIVSLDADCRVDKNYFRAIESDLGAKKDRSACSIYFEHPLSGTEFNDAIYRNIILYELHLRYYNRGLRYCLFPYAFHTIGSAIAFKAINYVRSGGMNRKQAGEDFYFIQKLIQQGGYFNITSTTVYPSPRESSRVPFGTGPVMEKLLSIENAKFYTFNTESFSELRSLCSSVNSLFSMSNSEVSDYFNNLPGGLKSFIGKKEWTEKIDEIKANTSVEESFVKRFFGWFNMFRIVRYMNHVHRNVFEKQDVIDAACQLLSLTGQKFTSNNPSELLLYYRSFEKDNNSKEHKA